MVHPMPALTSAQRFAEPLLQVLLAGVAALAYFGIRNLTAGSAETAMANAGRVADFEERAHLRWEENLQAGLLDSETLMTFANWVYIWGHWPVIVTTAVVLYRWRRPQYHLLRDAIFVSAAIGFLFFAFFPVAPPRLFDPGLVDTVTRESSSYRALQPPALTNQYAALPSLHFGWNLLVGVALWTATTNRLVRTLAVLSPAAMAVAVVITANHFVVDVVAGFVVVSIGLAAAIALARSRRGYPGPSALPGGARRR
jgi:hypothetical protein